jgi:hypothetical protein
LASPGHIVLRCPETANQQGQGNNRSDFLGDAF